MSSIGERQPITVNFEIASHAAHAAAGRRELNIYLEQYAAELVKDLGIPVLAEIRTTWVESDKITDPPQFRLLVDGSPGRMQWWPRILESKLAVREFATVLCCALHSSREELLGSGLADRLAREWRVRNDSGYVNGWSPEGFHEFLRLFARRNFHIRHAKAFAESGKSGASTPSEAALCFEEAIENAGNLALGVNLFLGAPLAPDEQTNYVEQLARQLRWFADDLGLPLAEIRPRASDRTLPPGDFKIELNDVRLPPMRRPAPD